jgi:hypothetical protein
MNIVVVSTGTPTVLTEGFHELPQFFQANAGIVPQTGPTLFLPYHIIYHSLTVLPFDAKSRDRSVGIATGYGVDDKGIGSSRPGGDKNFYFFMSPRSSLGPTQAPIQWVPGALSPEVKRPGREADHSTPTSTEVKKTWVYTSSPPYIFMA